ncbi:9049_t:CDS:2, partial [Dentiscutata erythropus]
ENMSRILSTITGVLGRLFRNLLPSWGDPMPPELPKPSELPEPEEGSVERESDYKTALAYQNTDTRCDEQIDLRKTGTYAMASLCFFQDVARYPRKAEDLSPEEDYTCWPIGPGEFKTFTHISVNPINFNLKYGIYHVFIGGQPAGQKCTRTFYYNPAGYYTHHDIQMAIDLGLHIELFSESPNALIFEPNQLMRGDEIFY